MDGNQYATNNIILSPEDSSKIANLNGELYKLSSEKDQLYTKMASIQKNIDEIRQKYKNSPQEQNNNQENIIGDIMEYEIYITPFSVVLESDDRAIDVIEFKDKPNNNQQHTSNHQQPSLVVDDNGKINHVKADNNESGDSIFVSFRDGGKYVIGKVYKVSPKEDWETRVIYGNSDTFEEMAFVGDLGVYGVLDKLEGFYDDVKIEKKRKVDKILMDRKSVNENYNLNLLSII